MTGRPQQEREAVGAVLAVVGDENPQWRGRAAEGSLGTDRTGSTATASGSVIGELAALSDPGAPDRHAAAVHFGHLLDQRQADAEPGLRASQVAIELHEHAEHLFLIFRRDADAGIAHRERHAIALRIGDNPTPGRRTA